MAATHSPDDMSQTTDSPATQEQADNSVSLETENEKQVLRERVIQLEEKVDDLEREISRARGVYRDSLNVREKVKPLLFVSAALFLAILPPLLVFMDRWLGYSDIRTPLDDLWRQVPFLEQTALPSYFATVIVSSIVLLVLILVWKDEQFLVTKAEFQAGLGEEPFVVRSDQLRYGKILITVAGAIYLLTAISGWIWQPLIGWGFFLALSLYALGWFLVQVPLETVTDAWQKNWEWVGSFLIFHVALILFLADISLGWQSHWIFGILLVLSLVNLVRFFRRIPAILWVVNLAVVLYTFNINSWAFSVIGDDFGFYMKALEIAETTSFSNVISQLFDARGVYGTHPFFSSVLQAVSLKLWGMDSFGWRFSSLYLSALSILFFYLFFKTFLPKRTALLGAIFLAVSSYIMSFGKIGYNNLQSLFAMSLALASSAWAIRSKRFLAFVVLGFSLGFCLYVYPAALYALFLPILLLLFYYPPTDRRTIFRWAIMLITFGLLLYPILIQPDFWEGKLPGLFFNNPEIFESSKSIVEHFASNFLLSFFSFLYTPSETHFVASSFIDPLSAIFLLLGLVYVIKWARKERFFVFLLIGFVILLALVGTSHDRRFPPTTRMFLLLPWYALLATIGLQWLVDRIAALGVVQLSKVSLYSLTVLGLIGFNLYQAYPLSQRRSTGGQTMEVLYVRLMERLLKFEPQVAVPKTILFLTEESWGIDGFYWLHRVYEVPSSRVRPLRAVVESGDLPVPSEELVKDRNTLVILQPSMDSTWQGELGSQLESLGKESCDIKEYTNRDTRFVLWYSPGLESLCVSDQ